MNDNINTMLSTATATHRAFDAWSDLADHQDLTTLPVNISRVFMQRTIKWELNKFEPAYFLNFNCMIMGHGISYDLCVLYF